MAWLTQQYLHGIEGADPNELRGEHSLIINAITDLESCLKAELGAFGTDVAGKYSGRKSTELLSRRILALRSKNS